MIEVVTLAVRLPGSGSVRMGGRRTGKHQQQKNAAMVSHKALSIRLNKRMRLRVRPMNWNLTIAVLAHTTSTAQMQFVEVAISDSDMNYFLRTESVKEVSPATHFVTAESVNLKK